MFEFVLGLLLSWPFLAICIILAIFSEYHESAWTIVFTIAIAAVSFFYFDLALRDFLIGIPVYIIVGVVWSFWRYKRYVNKMVSKSKNADGTLDERDYERLQETLSPTRMLSTIVFWICVWPFSLLENVLEDLITGIETLVTTVFRSIYRRIYDSAFSGVQIKKK